MFLCVVLITGSSVVSCPWSVVGKAYSLGVLLAKPGPSSGQAGVICWSLPKAAEQGPVSDELYDQIQAAAAVIRARHARRPRVALVLGSGLGQLAERFEDATRFDYHELPHFIRATVIGHQGRLVCGRLEGVEVVAMQGRNHGYEGYTQRQVTFPVRVMRALGAEILIVSNAAGGINPYYEQGDVVALDDHINMTFDNPLVGPNDERLGSRWPDMCQPYCPRLIALAQQAGRAADFPVHRGVYLAVRGPNYEPRAEYRFYRQIGADLVGMSTVPEVIVGVHAGMRVLGLSVVTNLCTPEALGKVTGAEVVAVAEKAANRLAAVVCSVLRNLEAA
ncbi:MAG: purine-nucleoside phosphorylase [Planctomycetes bacterium]|nr:purine-nucleoside phosphorylase [Planctomycetota bacterium]